MLLFLLVDLAPGVPLRTPVLLGNALFHGEGGGRDVAVTMPAVQSGLFALAEREKRVLVLIFMLGCCLAVVFVAMVYGLSQWVRGAIRSRGAGTPRRGPPPR